MFSLLSALFTFSLVSYSQSLQLTSVDNAAIPTFKNLVNTDSLSYEKVVKNKSGSICLPFLIKNSSNAVPTNVLLSINNETEVQIELVESGKEPSRGAKIFLSRENFKNDSTMYTVKFNKIDNIKPGSYLLCLTVNSIIVCAVSYVFSSPIIMEFSKPKLGLEGDPIRITCNYESYPNATQIIWSVIKGDNFTTANKSVISSNEHFEIKAGKETNRINDTLYIKSLLKNDTGIYMCNVVSNGQEDVALFKINVKDRWAALYPFIGIVIEVAILVTAILVYEKYQIRSQSRRTKGYDDNVADTNDDGGAKEPAIPLAPGGGDEDTIEAENGTAGEAGAERATGIDLRQRDALSKNV